MTTTSYSSSPIDSFSNSPTFSTSDGYGERMLESIETYPELNQIHIIYRRIFKFFVAQPTTSTSIIYHNNCVPQNDKLEKEIWGVDNDGKLKLFRVIMGEVIPPSSTPEIFCFNDPESVGNIDQSSSDSEA